jgi:hypothetical protein
LTAVRLYREDRPEEFLDHVPTAKALLPDLFGDAVWGGVHGFLFPTALARAAGGFDESLRFAEDWNFFCRVGLHGPQLVTDRRVGAYYRLRRGSMSTDRVGMTATRARLLIDLHNILRTRGRPDWFGDELLKSEQFTYYSLVLMQAGEPRLLDELLQRIQELQGRVGFGTFGWRFRLLARLLGYARAERLRCRVVRALRRRPKPTVDMGEWRER